VLDWIQPILDSQTKRDRTKFLEWSLSGGLHIMDHQSVTTESLIAVSTISTNLGHCTRGGQSRELIASWLQKAICRGQIKEAFYCAAELDLSGWSLFLWERLFWIGWAHIGLANPLVPMSLYSLYERWVSCLQDQEDDDRGNRRVAGEEEEEPLDLETARNSASCIKAQCILMLAVNWLTQERKNQLILHCSAATLLETTGCLSDADWDQKLGTNRRLKVVLEPVRLQACTSEAKAIVCLCRSMLENDEDRATRMVNLLHIWGQAPLVWVAVQKLCEVNTSNYFSWAASFIESYKKVWSLCRNTRRKTIPQLFGKIFLPPHGDNKKKEVEVEEGVEPERLPLFQIILLMIPGRNFRMMFPEGVHNNAL